MPVRQGTEMFVLTDHDQGVGATIVTDADSVRCQT